jgi:hypothetical protein
MPEASNLATRSRSTAQNLFEQFGGEVFPSAVIPAPGKRAIRRYFEDEAGAKVPSDAPFGYVLVPADTLAGAIGGGSEGSFPDFAAYHRWYLAQGGMPRTTKSRHTPSF